MFTLTESALAMEPQFQLSVYNGRDMTCAKSNVPIRGEKWTKRDDKAHGGQAYMILQRSLL